MRTDHEREKKQFAEEFGILFEQMSLPRMAGRIWGWLLTAEPPHQSAAEIAAAVSASRGSVSTMTRLLIQSGLIEAVGVPGERRRYYRIRSGGFPEILRAKVQVTSRIREMAERGLELLRGAPKAVRAPLEEYRDCCLFFEREFPAFVARWERRRRSR
jgi:DNA-binding transcriptional regulator GbsR (MarR family)